MMTTNQKKVAALAALGLLWGGILAWEWLAVEEPVRVPLTNVSGPASTPRAPRGTVDGLHVQLDLLGQAGAGKIERLQDHHPVPGRSQRVLRVRLCQEPADEH